MLEAIFAALGQTSVELGAATGRTMGFGNTLLAGLRPTLF